MRVITGTARGRKLVAPQGEGTRPTSDMAKEALFSIIQFEVEGSLVLDLFGGSGQLAIEALSRGARGAVVVESARAAQDAIRLNLQTTGFAKQARLVCADAATFLAGCTEQFDIALLDPPYHLQLIDRALPLLPPCMNPGGIIICETARDEAVPASAGAFVMKKQYRYGKVMLTTYRCEGER